MDPFSVTLYICFVKRTAIYKDTVTAAVDSNSGDLILIDPDDQHPDYQWGQLTDVVDEASYEWKYERIATSDALGIIQERVIDRVPKLIGPRLQQVFDDIWADKLAYFESIGATTAPVNESQHPNSIVE